MDNINNVKTNIHVGIRRFEDKNGCDIYGLDEVITRILLVCTTNTV